MTCIDDLEGINTQPEEPKNTIRSPSLHITPLSNYIVKMRVSIILSLAAMASVSAADSWHTIWYSNKHCRNKIDEKSGSGKEKVHFKAQSVWTTCNSWKSDVGTSNNERVVSVTDGCNDNDYTYTDVSVSYCPRRKA